MNIHTYRLPENASLIDKLTLGLMKWWFRGGRIGAAGVIVSVVLLAPALGSRSDPGPLAAVVALGLGWRVGRGPGPPRSGRYRPGPVLLGVVLGIVLLPFIGLFIFLALLPLRVLLLSIPSFLQLVVIGAMFGVAFLVGRRRRQFAERGVYPKPMTEIA